MMTKREFDLLTLLADGGKEMTQREIADVLSCSVGTVNRLIKELSEQKLIESNELTASGIQALEPFRVKRAIFIAAGFGARLMPITLNTPKPLVRVNGQRIIDSMIDAVIEAGIPEIYIVRGYLSEQFDQLLYKYPGIKFVENPSYNESNNISSAMCVRYLFKNAYVMDADLIIKNTKLIRKYEYNSNLLGSPVDRTDDWCVTLDKSNAVDRLTVGGTNGYRMIGVSYWDSEAGAKMAEDLEEVFYSPGGKERFWEEVPLHYKKDNYRVSVRECADDDILEVDSLNDLKAIDKSYIF